MFLKLQRRDLANFLTNGTTMCIFHRLKMLNVFIAQTVLKLMTVVNGSFIMKALHVSEYTEKLPQAHGLFTQNATAAWKIVFPGDLSNSYSQVNGQLEIEVHIPCTGSLHRSTNEDQYCIGHREGKRNPCFRWKSSPQLEVKLHVIQKKELKD